MNNAPHEPSPYAPFRMLTLALVFSALVVGIIGWNIWSVHERQEKLHERYAALVANIGRIIYLDEVLTMSARMAAASGDQSYEGRYNTYDPELSGLIKETIGMFPESGTGQYSRETDDANARLVEMERHSFALIHEGRRAEASELLNSPEYLRQKEIYAEGMKKTLGSGRRFYDRSLSQERNYQHASFVVSALSLLILFFAWALTLRRVRQSTAEHKKNDESLRESHRRFKAVLDSLDSFVYVADMTTYEILMLNQYGQKVWGDVVGRTCWKTLQSGQDGPCPFCTNARLLLPGGDPAAPIVWEFQNTVTHQWYECHDQAIRWSDGRMVRMEIATDITERKRTVEALRRSESALREAQSIAHIGSWELDLLTNQLLWSDETYRIFGVKQTEFSATYEAFLETVHPDDRAAVHTAYTDSLRKDLPYDVVHRIVSRSDGEVRYVHELCRHERDGSGQIVRSFGTVQDITELKNAEEESQTILRTAMDGFLIVDTKGNIIDVNDSYCRTMGYSRQELLLKRISDVEASLTPEEITARIAQIREQGAVRFGSRHRRKDGSLVDFEISINYSPEKGGRFISFVRDVTEHNRLENQLRQAQKMEAVGILAGGVAHDFNNILSAIVGYGSLLKLSVKDDHKVNTYADQILASAERAAGLTRGLLSFSRKQIVELKQVNINDIVYGIHKILTRLIGEDIEFKLNLAAQSLTVEADKGQIEQVLMNLVTNARDAMPRGGKLSLSTEAVTMAEDFGQMRRGPYAVMAVTDTGSGMTRDIAEHIFEPFFTTKETGRGTGLGLSIVYGIIRKHGGDVSVYSEPGEGTTFRIYLPLKPSSAGDAEPAQQAPLPSGNETILLAEDEDAVRAATRAMLTEFGYTVLEAVDGEDAVRIFRDNRDRVQLVLCDLIMPKKNGTETCREIRAIRPDIKYVFISGYTADTISQRGLLEEGISFISKPPTLTTLLTKIREVLDA